MKLLLVDDDEVDRMTVTRLLAAGPQDLEISAATTAAEAFECLRQDSFDVVLLDYRLPDMDGIDVLKTINADPEQSVAVIILTGMASEEEERRCIEAGAQDFVLKSDISDRRLRRALMHSRVRHTLEENLRESRARLQRMAETDALTGISNRYRFEQVLASETERCRKGGADDIVLLLIDIDNFKLVNDSMGHHAGDELLVQTAARLSNQIAPSHVLCRLGGDEFAIIAPGNWSSDRLTDFTGKLRQAFSVPLTLGPNSIMVNISSGIALLSTVDSSAEDLLKAAGVALEIAKKSGKNTFRCFSADMQKQAQLRAELARDMQSPGFLEQLELFFQPLVSAALLTLQGAEALVRWHHPDHGLLEPGAFLPVARETGMMTTIDLWGRRAACLQTAAWFRDGRVGAKFRMSFNICAATLRQKDFAAHLLKDIAETGVPPTSMELEVTESDLIADFDHAARQLLELRNHGVGIAIDDFGTGYSSLSYLRQLPADTVKLDRTFIANTPGNEDDCRLLRTLIMLAHSLDLNVTAEGIETEEQGTLCQSYNADTLQGYFFGRPRPAPAFADGFLPVGA
ncbi:EAL domain-containing protein [uncultured Martelella sp.]|uniref:putative bifunctional diguanylate cyclase/phosphodiesterase n=1 Tax=uncultured Martelella sp. TaxID=392331 RepID=UPI0029C7B4CF|nr:EAL domain-containing protein [uncultured Martelella sp.]